MRRGELGWVARGVVEIHRAAPAAVVAAALVEGGEVRVHGEAAAGALWPEGPAATTATPFDLASVTKPLVALTMARLVRRGELQLDEPLARFLPELATTASADVPILQFAAHRAGLEAHQKLYLPRLEGRAVELRTASVAAANARRADAVGVCPPEGFAPVYSDMGYLLLGQALEARTGLALDELVAREVLAPLNLDGAMGSARRLRERPEFERSVAPTEIVEFRGGVVRGEVHDENAWALVGDGLAGHAGAFGTAATTCSVGVAVLQVMRGLRDEWLTPAELEPLVMPRAGGSLRAGFDGRSGDSPSSGARLGPRTVGHLGFTGTSLWIDPESGFVGVLLTNRVHPTREHTAIRAARPWAYDAMFDTLRGSIDGRPPCSSP